MSLVDVNEAGLIRACNLKPGQMFRRLGIDYIVTTVNKKNIIFHSLNSYQTTGRIGAKSKELLVYLGTDYRYKSVIQIDDKGFEVARFENISEAAKQNGISKSGISNVLCKRYKRSGGFDWKRA